MPDEITELRELLLTAIANTELAADASQAAQAAMQEAREAELRTDREFNQAADTEQQARDDYVAALRRHHYAETASGPRPRSDYGPDAALYPCGCPMAHVRDHGNHQEGCENYRSDPLAPTAAELARGRQSAQALAAELPGNLGELR